jgi:hypothetical protein
LSETLKQCLSLINNSISGISCIRLFLSAVSAVCLNEGSGSISSKKRYETLKKTPYTRGRVIEVKSLLTLSLLFQTTRYQWRIQERDRTLTVLFACFLVNFTAAANSRGKEFTLRFQK